MGQGTACFRLNIRSCVVIFVRLTQCWRSCRTAIEDLSHLIWWRCLRASNFLQLLSEASALIWVWQYWAHFCSYLLCFSSLGHVSAGQYTPPWHSSLSLACLVLIAVGPRTLNLLHSLVTQLLCLLFPMKVLFAGFYFLSCCYSLQRVIARFVYFMTDLLLQPAMPFSWYLVSHWNAHGDLINVAHFWENMYKDIFFLRRYFWNNPEQRIPPNRAIRREGKWEQDQNSKWCFMPQCVWTCYRCKLSHFLQNLNVQLSFIGVN